MNCISRSKSILFSWLSSPAFGMKHVNIIFQPVTYFSQLHFPITSVSSSKIWRRKLATNNCLAKASVYYYKFPLTVCFLLCKLLKPCYYVATFQLASCVCVGVMLFKFIKRNPSLTPFSWKIPLCLIPSSNFVHNYYYLFTQNVIHNFSSW